VEKELAEILGQKKQPFKTSLNVIQEKSTESKRTKGESGLLHHKSVEQFAEAIGIPVVPMPMEEPKKDSKLDEMINAYKM
jgi:hypothetical protein